MSQFEKKNLALYLWLGGIWLVVGIFFSIINGQELLGKHISNQLWRTPYIVVANYIFLEYGLPLITKRRTDLYYNLLLAIIIVPLQCVFLSFGLYAWLKLGMELNFYTQFRFVHLIPDVPYNRLIDASLYEARIGIASLCFFGAAKLFFNNYKLKQLSQKLLIEKQQAELNYLKSQTNPHFLFNTLNNIYSLAREKSDQTPESILRLSKILRFMLYDAQADYINIEEELDLIRNYISLEKLRYDDSMKLSFTHDVDDMKQQLPPLLLIPLIENAFKHGVSEISDHSFVDIQLSIKNKQLKLIVKNSSEAVEEKQITENIGLSNLRRQLELLYMEYELFVNQEGNIFTAVMNINLESHV